MRLNPGNTSHLQGNDLSPWLHHEVLWIMDKSRVKKEGLEQSVKSSHAGSMDVHWSIYFSHIRGHVHPNDWTLEHSACVQHCAIRIPCSSVFRSIPANPPI